MLKFSFASYVSSAAFFIYLYEFAQNVVFLRYMLTMGVFILQNLIITRIGDMITAGFNAGKPVELLELYASWEKGILSFLKGLRFLLFVTYFRFIRTSDWTEINFYFVQSCYFCLYVDVFHVFAKGDILQHRHTGILEARIVQALQMHAQILTWQS